MRSDQGTIIDDIFKSELSLIMSTCMWENPMEKRREPSVYGEVLIVSCKYDNWWYRDLVGMTFFCRLHFFRHPHKKDMQYLYSAHVVKLTKTKVFQGRGFDVSDIQIV